MFTQFQVRNRKDVMLPNGSINSLSRREKMFGSIRGSIGNYACTVSSAELKGCYASERKHKLLIHDRKKGSVA